VTPSPFEFLPGPPALRGDRWDGEAGVTPVIFLHGGGQTRRSWRGTAERIAATGRPTANYDARGHGDSDWDPAGDYMLPAFAADLVGVIEVVGAPAILVGASLGGLTGLLVAGRRPELVRALVLVDVVVDLDQEGVKRVRRFMRAHPDGFGSLAEAAEAVSAYNPNRPPSTNIDGLRSNLFQGEDGRWRWHWDPAFVPAVGAPEPLVRIDDLRAAARQVVAPTLIIRGVASDVVTEAGVAATMELIPHAETVAVGRAGHMVAGDNNAVFADSLEGFIESVDAGPGGPTSPVSA